MNVLLLGATGLVGQGALTECLADPRVAAVCVLVRRPTGRTHPKLTEIVLRDLLRLDTVEHRLTGFDACFYCIGVPMVGRDEAEYAVVVHDLTVKIATSLVRLNPDMVFVYVSCAGADRTEEGGVMWARVRGRTENAILDLPFRGAYVFRPGMVQPVRGVRAKTWPYRFIYGALAAAYPMLGRLFSASLITTAQIGQAMIAVADGRHSARVLETRDLNGFR